MRLLLRIGLVLATLGYAPSALAYKFQIAESTTLNIDYLLQVQAQFVENGAPNKSDYSKDFFIRRSRIILFGNLIKRISYFMETDHVNLGKNGDWSAPFFVQDAFMSFDFYRQQVMVDAGMILLPFTRHNIQGAIGLNGIDYHASMIKFPDGTHKYSRDAGAQLRGYLFNSKLQYRVGLFAGSQGLALQKDAAGAAVKDAAGAVVAVSNPHDFPRATGHVRYNILGTETDFFAKGITFSRTPTLSIGIGADFAPDSVLREPAVLDATTLEVTTPAKIGHHFGLGADVFLDYPVGVASEISFQAAFLYYDDGPRLKTSGWGVLSELGYRWKFLEPVGGFDMFGSKDAAGDFKGIHAGLNFWILAHTANLKAHLLYQKTGSSPWSPTFTLQAQLFL